MIAQYLVDRLWKRFVNKFTQSNVTYEIGLWLMQLRQGKGFDIMTESTACRGLYVLRVYLITDITEWSKSDRGWINAKIVFFSDESRFAMLMADLDLTVMHTKIT